MAMEWKRKLSGLLAGGPKWEPAQQNGKTVATYRKQPITFVVSDQ
jgi:hypothetical protein